MPALLFPYAITSVLRILVRKSSDSRIRGRCRGESFAESDEEDLTGDYFDDDNENSSGDEDDTKHANNTAMCSRLPRKNTSTTHA